MLLDSLNERLEKKRGKSGGYPEDMHYKITKKTDETFELCIEDSKKGDDLWKKVDPWSFAVFDEVHKKLAPLGLGLHFAMSVPSSKNGPKYEALKRRLSYLAEVNKGIPIALSKGGQKDCLYTMPDLNKRPENEVVRDGFGERSDDDKPRRLEKDFQTYLFGKGLHGDSTNGVRTNERLALFGKDFFNGSKKVAREWPTGVFRGEKKEENRILPTELIDLVTINKHNEIALLELKFLRKEGLAKLEDISQLLNYALFFHSYKARLAPLLDTHVHSGSANFGVRAYLASNTFHSRFDSVWPYYSRGPIIPMQQIVMGYTPDK